MPTDDVCVSETLAGIRREAAKKGQIPLEKVAATVTILLRLLAPISDDLRGLRDRAVLLVGFTGALRRSELAAIRFQQLEKTDRGIRLTLPQTKGEQTDAVTAPLPYGDTELCPVRALELWQQVTGLTERPGVPADLVATVPASSGGGGVSSPAPDRRRRDHAQTMAQIVRARAMAAVSGGTTSAVTVSTTARSPPEWSAASILPN